MKKSRGISKKILKRKSRKIAENLGNLGKPRQSWKISEHLSKSLQKSRKIFEISENFENLQKSGNLRKSREISGNSENLGKLGKSRKSRKSRNLRRFREISKISENLWSLGESRKYSKIWESRKILENFENLEKQR